MYGGGGGARRGKTARPGDTDLARPSSLLAPGKNSLGSAQPSAAPEGLSLSPASSGCAALPSSEDEDELWERGGTCRPRGCALRSASAPGAPASQSFLFAPAAGPRPRAEGKWRERSHSKSDL